MDLVNGYLKRQINKSHKDKQTKQTNKGKINTYHVVFSGHLLHHMHKEAMFSEAQARFYIARMSISYFLPLGYTYSIYYRGSFGVGALAQLGYVSKC